MSSSAPEPEPHVVEDCRGVLQLLSDGTVRRSDAEPTFSVQIRDGDDGGVEWKDVVYDTDHGLGARLYRPKPATTPGSNSKFPVLAYFHGGGFCIGSCRWRAFHAWCLRLAAALPAVVVSFDYRLAPEHRLPAAQEDGARALAWLARHAGDDPWLAAADLARVFVAGDSAGGNIAHHAAVGGTVKLRGCVLLMPAMSGEARTPSESECPPESFLTADLADRYLRLALPEGADRDHPALNLEATPLHAVAVPPVLVVAAGRDFLRDRNRLYVARMKEWGKEVEYAEIEGEQHVFFLLDAWSESADEVVRIVRKFVVDHME